ncbi:hypothetical protein FF38_06477 [Lucilia cuprina]|uniref:Uncharacterized protein n=1 Tax=Lucilia cuprina TaxID=7375 RepID=A0A0L0C5V9_LUCCU|nr:hypothetical protein FF38_06477 [Lucilia cuprina]
MPSVMKMERLYKFTREITALVCPRIAQLKLAGWGGPCQQSGLEVVSPSPYILYLTNNFLLAGVDAKRSPSHSGLHPTMTPYRNITTLSRKTKRYQSTPGVVVLESSFSLVGWSRVEVALQVLVDLYGRIMLAALGLYKKKLMADSERWRIEAE